MAISGVFLNRLLNHDVQLPLLLNDSLSAMTKIKHLSWSTDFVYKAQQKKHLCVACPTLFPEDRETALLLRLNPTSTTETEKTYRAQRAWRWSVIVTELHFFTLPQASSEQRMETCSIPSKTSRGTAGRSQSQLFKKLFILIFMLNRHSCRQFLLYTLKRIGAFWAVLESGSSN